MNMQGNRTHMTVEEVVQFSEWQGWSLNPGILCPEIVSETTIHHTSQAANVLGCPGGTWYRVKFIKKKKRYALCFKSIQDVCDLVQQLGREVESIKVHISVLKSYLCWFPISYFMLHIKYLWLLCPQKLSQRALDLRTSSDQSLYCSLITNVTKLFLLCFLSSSYRDSPDPQLIPISMKLSQHMVGVYV